MLKLDNRGGSLTGHVMDSILVAQPVRALDGIVHVPSPVILVHVAESSVDATLGGDSVTSSGKQLRDTGSVEASLGETKGGTETSTTGTDDEGIVLVVLNIDDELIRLSLLLRAVVSRDCSGPRRNTYNDVVLCADMRRSLLGSQGMVGNNSSCNCSPEVSPCSQLCRCILRSDSPAGRVVEKALAWLLANREN